MNTLKHLFYLILVSLTVVSCVREYDAPPIPAPLESNITIAKLKQQYKNTVAGTPQLIEVAYVIKGYVVGNDESGNIFKQLYIEDESGAINIGVDQNSIYGLLSVGQEVLINVHGLSMVNYGGELQIGYANTNANRIPWLIFQEHMGLSGLPDPANVKPTVVKIGDLNESMVNRLVRFNEVYFVNGGKGTFTSPSVDAALSDGDGKSIIVRTSSFATFSKDTLPKDGGNIVGVLGRFNGTWQLVLRSTADLIAFGGPIPGPTGPVNPTAKVIYSETFGGGTYTTVETRLKIANFTDFDVKNTVVYTDPTGNSDIRSTTAFSAHVWMPAGKEAGLTISGINTSGVSDLVLSFDIAAGVSTSGVSNGNLNVMTVKCNGDTFTIPSTPVSAPDDSNKLRTFTFKNIPSVQDLKLEFFAGTNNTTGLRLDNIKIVSDNSITLQ